MYGFLRREDFDDIRVKLVDKGYDPGTIEFDRAYQKAKSEEEQRKTFLQKKIATEKAKHNYKPGSEEMTIQALPRLSEQENYSFQLEACRNRTSKNEKLEETANFNRGYFRRYLPNALLLYQAEKLLPENKVLDAFTRTKIRPKSPNEIQKQLVTALWILATDTGNPEEKWEIPNDHPNLGSLSDLQSTDRFDKITNLVYHAHLNIEKDKKAFSFLGFEGDKYSGQLKNKDIKNSNRYKFCWDTLLAMQYYRIKKVSETQRKRWFTYEETLAKLINGYTPKPFIKEQDGKKENQNKPYTFIRPQDIGKRTYYTLSAAWSKGVLYKNEDIEGIWFRPTGKGMYEWGRFTATAHTGGPQVAVNVNVRFGVVQAENYASAFNGWALTIGFDLDPIGFGLSGAVNLEGDWGVEPSKGLGFDAGGGIGLVYSKTGKRQTGSLEEMKEYIKGLVIFDSVQQAYVKNQLESLNLDSY